MVMAGAAMAISFVVVLVQVGLRRDEARVGSTLGTAAIVCALVSFAVMGVVALTAGPDRAFEIGTGIPAAPLQLVASMIGAVLCAMDLSRARADRRR